MGNQYSFDRKRMGWMLLFPLVTNFWLLIDAVSLGNYGLACVLILCVTVLFSAMIVLLKLIKNPPIQKKKVVDISVELNNEEDG